MYTNAYTKYYIVPMPTKYYIVPKPSVLTPTTLSAALAVIAFIQQCIYIHVCTYIYNHTHIYITTHTYIYICIRIF